MNKNSIEFRSLSIPIDHEVFVCQTLSEISDRGMDLTAIVVVGDHYTIFYQFKRSDSHTVDEFEDKFYKALRQRTAK